MSGCFVVLFALYTVAMEVFTVQYCTVCNLFIRCIHFTARYFLYNVHVVCRCCCSCVLKYISNWPCMPCFGCVSVGTLPSVLVWVWVWHYQRGTHMVLSHCLCVCVWECVHIWAHLPVIFDRLNSPSHWHTTHPHAPHIPTPNMEPHSGAWKLFNSLLTWPTNTWPSYSTPFWPDRPTHDLSYGGHMICRSA